MTSRDDGLAVTEGRVRDAGLRVTTARVRVLAELTASGGLLSHQDLEGRLGRPHMDRVTLYRVLESLAECGLVHRVSGGDRVWRFGVVPAGAGGRTRQAHDQHAHFQCRDCGKLVCLDALTQGDAVRVPQGYHAESVELTVRGRCPQCAGPGTA